MPSSGQIMQLRMLQVERYFSQSLLYILRRTLLAVTYTDADRWQIDNFRIHYVPTGFYIFNAV